MPAHVLLLGTRNRKKRDELRELLQLPSLELLTMDALGPLPEIVEDGQSFAENARKKATALAKATGLWTLGEDSGLVVAALGARPGVHSARYAGEPCDDERNNAKLLAELASTQDADRRAHYVCSAIISDATGTVRAESQGDCRGRIARAPRGGGGFGYDPLFLPDGFEQTFGELPSEFKQCHSHRAQAIRVLRPQLVTLMKSWFDLDAASYAHA